MITPEQALAIAGGILPRIRRFPRNQAAQVAILAECAKLLSTRCATESQALEICQQHEQPGAWVSVQHFERAITAALADISLQDQRSYAAFAANEIHENWRLHSLIGHCGRPYPADLSAHAPDFYELSLLEQARLGRDVMEAGRAIEREIWADIQQLSPLDRASLERFAATVWPPECLTGAAIGKLRWAMCVTFEDWRKTQCA